jgi:hypothetical protein
MQHLTIFYPFAEAYEFLHQIGYSSSTVPVSLKIVKQAMRIHELESALSTYFLIGYEEGFRKSDLEKHFGPAVANAFHGKIGEICIDKRYKPEENDFNKDSEAGKRKDTDETMGIAEEGTCTMDTKVTCDQLERDTCNNTSTSTEDGGDVFYDASPDRECSSVFDVGQAECDDLKQVKKQEPETFGRMIEQEQEKLSRISADRCARESPEADDNDDHTLTDREGSKTAELMPESQSDQESHARRSPKTASTIERGVQTTSGFVACDEVSMGTRPTQEQGAPGWQFPSKKNVPTSEAASQTTKQSMGPSNGCGECPIFPIFTLEI